MAAVWTLVLIFGYHSANPQPHVEAFGIASKQACLLLAIDRLAKYPPGDIAVQCVVAVSAAI